MRGEGLRHGERAEDEGLELLTYLVEEMLAEILRQSDAIGRRIAELTEARRRLDRILDTVRRAGAHPGEKSRS